MLGAGVKGPEGHSMAHPEEAQVLVHSFSGNTCVLQDGGWGHDGVKKNT